MSHDTNSRDVKIVEIEDGKIVIAFYFNGELFAKQIDVATDLPIESLRRHLSGMAQKVANASATMIARGRCEKGR